MHGPGGALTSIDETPHVILSAAKDLTLTISVA
jgi:hypothetical protein